MQNIYLTFISLLLLLGQFNAYGALFFQVADPHLPLPADSSLTVHASIYFGEQDEESEQVETNFYLLDESMIKILKAAKFKPVFPDGRKHRISEEDYLEAAAHALVSGDNREEIIVFLINEAMAAHQLSVTGTNSFGRGYFREIKKGNYYLFGFARIREQVIVWHLPVAIKSGLNSVELDQNNAATIFSLDD